MALNFKTSEEVEIAFYDAFSKGDYSLMQYLYADSDVSCLLPDNTLIIGSLNVLDYWSCLFDGIPPVQIERKLLNACHIHSLAIHNVQENIYSDMGHVKVSEIYTTNIYVLQNNGWKIQSQHSSLTQSTLQPFENSTMAASSGVLCH